MPFNGSGTFTLPAGNPVVTQTVIDSTVYNTTQSGFATGLSNCITKDGQTTITANIPFAGFRLTNLGNPSAVGDAVNAQTIQSFSLINLSSVSGTDTITATVSPTPSAYATGQMFIFEPANNNTGAATINISSLGAKDIYLNNAALVADVLVSGQPVMIRYNGTQFEIVGKADFASIKSRNVFTARQDFNFTDAGAGVVYIDEDSAGSSTAPKGLVIRREGTNLNDASPSLFFDVGGGGGNCEIYSTRLGGQGGRLIFATENTSGTMVVRARFNESGQFSVGAAGTNVARLEPTAGSALTPTYTFDSSSDVGMYCPAANSLGFVTGQVERARFDGSGYFLLGTTSSAGFGSADNLVVLNGSSTVRFEFGIGGAQHGGLFANATNVTLYTSNAGDHLNFQTAGSERARVTEGGYFKAAQDAVYVSTAGTYHELAQPSTTASNRALIVWHKATSGDNVFIEWFTDGGVSRAAIDYNRGAGQVRYNITSDRRLKSNIADLLNSGAIIDQLKPRSYVFTETGQMCMGFVADELQEVLPCSASGEPNQVDENNDPIYQQIAPASSAMIALIVAELKGLRARVQTLESI